MKGIVQPVNIKHQEIEVFERFGRELKVSPKANVTINKPGYKIEFFTETVTVVIGIGKHHIAEVIMTKDAWEDFNSGEKVHVTTTEEYKKKYVYSKKKRR